VQVIHIGLVREGVAIHEVEPAARHAGGDPVRLIGAGVDEIGADQIGELLLEVFRDQDAPA
jgi:hypothetical protein